MKMIILITIAFLSSLVELARSQEICTDSTGETSVCDQGTCCGTIYCCGTNAVCNDNGICVQVLSSKHPHGSLSPGIIALIVILAVLFAMIFSYFVYRKCCIKGVVVVPIDDENKEDQKNEFQQINQQKNESQFTHTNQTNNNNNFNLTEQHFQINTNNYEQESILQQSQLAANDQTPLQPNIQSNNNLNVDVLNNRNKRLSQVDVEMKEIVKDQIKSQKESQNSKEFQTFKQQQQDFQSIMVNQLPPSDAVTPTLIVQTVEAQWDSSQVYDEKQNINIKE